MKVTDLETKRKTCPFCGIKPACPDWTCKRLISVEVQTDGAYRVEFAHETSVAFSVDTDGPDAA